MEERAGERRHLHRKVETEVRRIGPPFPDPLLPPGEEREKQTRADAGNTRSRLALYIRASRRRRIRAPRQDHPRAFPFAPFRFSNFPVESLSSCHNIMLRLPHGVGPLFEDWLARHYPDRAEKVLNQVRALRGGRLNDPQFGSRMRGEGVFADQAEALFEAACRRAGIAGRRPVLSAAAFRVPFSEPGNRQSTFPF